MQISRSTAEFSQTAWRWLPAAVLLSSCCACHSDPHPSERLRALSRSVPSTPSPASATAPRPQAVASAPRRPSLRAASDWEADPDWGPKRRTRGATSRRLATVKRLFADVDLSWPPRQLLLRGFKHESELEVWANDRHGAPLRWVTRYAICRGSGTLGPKRRQGDFQVPEGFYRISYFNKNSRYHLSLRVNYPNRSDRILGSSTNLGGDIMIHGDCVSIGCLAMSDERAEEIWVMTRAAKRPVAVHLLPARDMTALLADDSLAQHHLLWRDLLTGTQLFERTRRLPKVKIDKAGRYHFNERP